MSTDEDHRKNIALIFDAIQVGLDDYCQEKTIEMTTPDEETIDPSRFNRAQIVIDGSLYTVSIFRPGDNLMEGVLAQVELEPATTQEQIDHEIDFGYNRLGHD